MSRRYIPKEDIEGAAEGVLEPLRKASTAFPHRWPKGAKERYLKFTVEPEDATRISSLLYEECDRGLIEVKIHAKPEPA